MKILSLIEHGKFVGLSGNETQQTGHEQYEDSLPYRA